jgi:hypothetical protein
MTNNDSLLARTMDIAARYGVQEDNPLALAAYTHEAIDYAAGDVPLADQDLVRIDRLRLLGDSDGWAYPYLDVSYCYGTLRDGRHVRVDLGTYRFPKRGLKAALVQVAKGAGRYAKGLGLLDDGVISRLY